MFVRKLALLLPLSLLISTVGYANTKSYYCPKTNMAAEKSSAAIFWRCATADGNCNGKDVLIGATLIDYQGGPRYFCSYSGQVQDSMVSRHRFPLPSPEQTQFKGHWQRVQGVDKIVCQSSNPQDCPVPAFHKQP